MYLCKYIKIFPFKLDFQNMDFSFSLISIYGPLKSHQQLKTADKIIAHCLAKRHVQFEES